MVRVEEALAAALPGVTPQRVDLIETGWDSQVVDVDGEWILRLARDENVAAMYEVEAALLQELAPMLPLPVPMPERSGEGWMLTRRLAGSAVRDETVGAQLASFLRALHTFPVVRARGLGLSDHRPVLDVERFRERVLPLLEADERAAAERLFAEHLAADFTPAVVHADLGPEHVLVDEGRITGVIDWTDIRIGDPAIDLAWPLHGSAFGAEVADVYGVDGPLGRRALVWHALGPWHEVLYGLARSDQAWVASGLAGVRDRLRKATGGADTMAR